MGRVRRVDVGEMVYHALNRANFRSRLLKSDAHYEDFLGIVQETLALVPMRILAYCLMPNHWHLVLYLRGDGDLARFLQRITLTHTQRYHARTRTVGYGHLYQGRYKSLPVESDGHFLALVRYVERNAKRAALVKRAEDWRWSSVHVRRYGGGGGQRRAGINRHIVGDARALQERKSDSILASSLALVAARLPSKRRQRNRWAG